MQYRILLLVFVLFFQFSAFSQNYTSYFTGNSIDSSATPVGGVCIMGGASEDDNAMTWFLQRANGGDILVLRTSGSDGYNAYMFSGLGVSVNSVETIVFNNAAASNEPYIHQKIQQAEGIWFAGGDQWNYVSYWRNTPVDSLINEAISSRNIVIGGTSAGMAIQGGFYFSAQNGTVTSSTALSNPYDNNVTVDSSAFLLNDYLSDVITDTHYDDPDRKGRHVVFLSRIYTDYGIAAKGIACDEYTAVCIDTNGMAKVYGEYPTYDDNAYFIQTNCELADITPEDCSPGNPLDWNLGNAAIKVYHINGTSNGSNTLDLNDWETGVGGTWENWYVDNGVLNQQPGMQPNCNALSIREIGQQGHTILVYPNPSSESVVIEFEETESSPKSLKIINSLGQIEEIIGITSSDEVYVKTSDIPPGLYFIEVTYKDNSNLLKKLIIN